MRVLTGERHRVGSLTLSADGHWLASAAERRPALGAAVQLWDLMGGGRAWSADLRSTVDHITFDPGGRHLLVTAYLAVTQLELGSWTVPAGDPFWHGFRPTAFSADGRAAIGFYEIDRPLAEGIRLARHGPDGWAEVWRVEVDRPAAELSSSSELVLDPRGEWAVRVHRGPYGRRLQSLDGRTGRDLGSWDRNVWHSNRSKAVSSAGVYVQRDATYFDVFDLGGRDPWPVRRLNTSRKHFTDLAFSPDGRWLATTSNDALVTIWETAGWTVARQFAWDIGRLRSVAFSPDGTLCAAGSDTGRVVVWDFDE